MAEEENVGKKYKKHDWNQELVFESSEQQTNYFQQNPHWKKIGSRDDHIGTATRYYCNAVKSTGVACPANIMVR